ncbi:unnamed protein product [Microthlaspi erraticum]|uniref:Uncharacterized protein n=1 Tax=Microthlaspi erraticum TaxID=1685480 RepID=A0A6D2HJY4_9BRAS|nr:unnamed protein product [Microthlaspi erraticum]
MRKELPFEMDELSSARWSMIASYMPGRTDNEIKNVWNTHLKKGKSLSSSNVTNHQASSVSSSSSAVSSLSNDVMNSEKPNQAEEFKGNFGELEPMACGFDLNAPQSLEFLFEDQQIPPPTAANPEESLDIQREEGQELPNQTVEPGQDECNEWLNLDYPTL